MPRGYREKLANRRSLLTKRKVINLSTCLFVVISHTPVCTRDGGEKKKRESLPDESHGNRAICIPYSLFYEEFYSHSTFVVETFIGKQTQWCMGCLITRMKVAWRVRERIYNRVEDREGGGGYVEIKKRG